MSNHRIPHFHNSNGVREIAVGAKEFMCVGAKPPHDHPHVFLDLGSDVEKVCPYCSTLYKYDPALASTQSNPENCAFHENAA